MNDTAIIHDGARQDATRHDTPPFTPPDTSRPDATRAYRLTLDEVAHRFDQAGLARSMRTLQRYCASGRLDCLKTDTVAGVQYFVDEHSVERTIIELKQLSALTQERPSQPDMSRQDATGSAMHLPNSDNERRQIDDTARHDATRHDTSPVEEHGSQARQDGDAARHVTTENDIRQPAGTPTVTTEPEKSTRQPATQPDMSRQVTPADTTAKDKIIEMQGQEISFLRQQINVKDEQLKDASERSRETNILIQGLQNMVLTLQAPLGEFTRRLTGEATPGNQPPTGFSSRQQ